MCSLAYALHYVVRRTKFLNNHTYIPTIIFQRYSLLSTFIKRDMIVAPCLFRA
jgi:hypothetical protein